jgi:hypothetical protein
MSALGQKRTSPYVRVMSASLIGRLGSSALSDSPRLRWSEEKREPASDSTLTAEPGAHRIGLAHRQKPRGNGTFAGAKSLCRVAAGAARARR